MNFVEALRSGRPFRRKGEEYYFTSEHFFEVYVPSNSKWFMERMFPDLLLDDWEIEEPTVTVTARGFYEAMRQALKAEGTRRNFDQTRGGYSYDAFNFVMAEIAKNLGLEPPL